MSGEVKLRPAERVDADVCFELDRICFTPEVAFPRDVFHVLCDTSEVFEVAEVDGRLVGFIAGNFDCEENVGIIVTLDVHPDVRARGIGERLLGTAHEQFEACGATAIFLQVFVENDAALRLYRKFGYTTICRFDDYYGPHKDALLMMRSLDDADDFEKDEDQCESP